MNWFLSRFEWLPKHTCTMHATNASWKHFKMEFSSLHSFSITETVCTLTLMSAHQSFWVECLPTAYMYTWQMPTTHTAFHIPSWRHIEKNQVCTITGIYPCSSIASPPTKWLLSSWALRYYETSSILQVWESQHLRLRRKSGRKHTHRPIKYTEDTEVQIQTFAQSLIQHVHVHCTCTSLHCACTCTSAEEDGHVSCDTHCGLHTYINYKALFSRSLYRIQHGA